MPLGSFIVRPSFFVLHKLKTRVCEPLEDVQTVKNSVQVKRVGEAEKCPDQQKQLGNILSDLYEGSRSLFSFIIYHIA